MKTTKKLGTWILGVLLLLPGYAQAASAIVSWSPNNEPDLAGYKVHYGTAPGTYANTVDVANVTSYTVPNLAVGNTYYFAVTAYDTTGNSSGLSTEVTLAVPAPDTTPPLLTPPPDLTVEATGALTAVDLGLATAVDAVDGPVPAVADQTGPFAIGTYQITWMASDSAGNTATATQVVTVVDTTGPSLTAPADVTIEATALLTPVDLGSASAMDLVDGTVAASPDQTGPFARGTHTITWTATDAAGNTSTVTQIVTVTDTTAPAPPGGLVISAQ